MSTVETLLSGANPLKAAFLMLVAAFVLWVAGKAIRTARSNPADENLMAFLHAQTEAAQAMTREALLTFRSSGKSTSTRRAPTAERAAPEPIVLPGQDEESLVARLRDVLSGDPGNWTPSERGFLTNFATPQRLAVVFATNPEFADKLLRYVNSAWRGQRDLRRELRERLQLTQGIDPTAVIAGPQATQLDSPTDPVGIPMLVGVGARNGKAG